MSDFDRPPKTDAAKLVERRESRELDFDTAVVEIANALEERILRGEKITGVVYGKPNMGKSTFCRRLVNELRSRSGLEQMIGGEVKSFKEVDDYVKERYEIIISQMVSSEPIEVGTDAMHRIITNSLDRTGLPSDYFSVVMIAPQIYPQYNARMYAGRVDYIVNNPEAVKKSI